jgi:cytoskeletal protein RodZ
MVKKKMKKQTGPIAPSPSLLSLFIVSAFVFLFAIIAAAISMQSEEIRMLISFPFANQAKAQQEQIQQSPPESPSSSSPSPSPSTPTPGPSSLPPNILQQQQPVPSSSVKTLPLVVQTLVSKINTTLNDATTTAIKSVGDNNNSLAIGTFLKADIDGGLAYKVFILDPDSPENLSILTVDPSNGRVLATAQLPAPGILSNMVVPPAGGVGGSGGGNIIGSAPLPGG